ncbi:hypothetical protein CR51_28780 [Caballeronia megalochromosomata]|nr:hypothetical protein CR51_28780 [Caballeronia megalochromosomata]
MQEGNVKANKENQEKELSLGLFIGIAIVIIYVIVALTLAVKWPNIGLSDHWLIIAELALLSLFLILLLLVKLIEGAVLWIASLRAIRWFRRYDENKRSQSSAQKEGIEPDEIVKRVESLRDALRERYGLRWRYRARWLLVSGERSLLEGLAPGLAATGWQLANDALLISGSQSDGRPDVNWLNALRKLRRHRPIDALVAITRVQDSTSKPFDIDSVGQRLARHGRVLRWAAPAYLLNVKECGGDIFKRDESIGQVWSNRRADNHAIDRSLARLAGDLSDVGVARLSLDPYDRVAAELAQQIDVLRTAFSDLVVRVGSSRIWRTAVHGLLFAAIPYDQEAEDGQGREKGRVDSQSAVVSNHALWNTIAAHSRKVYGRRVGFSWSTAAAWAAIAVAAIWLLGSMISGVANRSSMQEAASTLSTASSTHDATQALLALDALDKQLDTLEVHRKDGVPLLSLIHI